jgi:hypothetical protein
MTDKELEDKAIKQELEPSETEEVEEKKEDNTAKQEDLGLCYEFLFDCI